MVGHRLLARLGAFGGGSGLGPLLGLVHIHERRILVEVAVRLWRNADTDEIGRRLWAGREAPNRNQNAGVRRGQLAVRQEANELPESSPDSVSVSGISSDALSISTAICFSASGCVSSTHA